MEDAGACAVMLLIFGAILVFITYTIKEFLSKRKSKIKKFPERELEPKERVPIEWVPKERVPRERAPRRRVLKEPKQLFMDKTHKDFKIVYQEKLKAYSELDGRRKLTKDEQEHFAKGETFESVVDAHFHRSMFTLDGWSADRNIHEEKFDEKLDPYRDLEYIDKKTGTRIHIECKYRSNTNFGDGVRWANTDEFERYKEFERNNPQSEYFLIVGLGGRCYWPEKIFVKSMKDMENTRISGGDLRNSVLVPYQPFK